MTIGDLYWHDSKIINVLIDRSAPGHCDRIEFDIEWVDIGRKSLIFEDVIWANINWNMGMIIDECFDRAYIGDETDTDLSVLYQKVPRLKNMQGLSLYVLQTNSSGSVFKILARKFAVV